MNTALQQQYWECAHPECKKIQQSGTKMFTDQHDDELVIQIVPGSFTSYMNLHSVIAFVWILAVAGSLMVLVSGMNALLQMQLIIALLMLAMCIDALTMLTVINKSLSNLLVTSKRIISFDYGGLMTDRSNVINFDNLNDCVHAMRGLFGSEWIQSGRLTLKLASGEERVFRHVKQPQKAVSLISRMQELYKAHGHSGGTITFFAPEQQTGVVNPQVAEDLIQNIITQKRSYRPYL